jgi:competence protein ComEC
MSPKNNFQVFWERNPALFFGLCVFLGAAASFCTHWFLFLTFVLLTLSSKRKIWAAALICFVASFLSASYRCPKTLLPHEKISGTAIFHIDQVKIQSSPFNRSTLYKGTLKRFDGEGKMYANLPCHLYLPLYGKHPPGNTDYAIDGILCQKGDYHFVLKPEKNRNWTAIPDSPLNLSQWRFNTKKRFSKYLKGKIEDPHARTFLNALATGDIDERLLSLEFGKIGLQHILAISGFHFALAALFFNFIFRLFFSYRTSAILLLIAITSYYLFLGNAPSIQRAYIAISLLAIGQLLSRRISGLNALGAGLLVEMIFHPLAVIQLSFQLTFLCTLAIFLFYPLMDRAVCFLLPERSYKELEEMPNLDRHGYLLSALLRKALAVNLAVHCVSIPVVLFFFHKFPLLSIAYNLFFPVCASLSMFLLFAALVFSVCLPFVSDALHQLNNGWTSTILKFVSNPPALLDFSVHTKAISFSGLCLFLTLSFFLAVVFQEKERAFKR